MKVKISFLLMAAILMVLASCSNQQEGPGKSNVTRIGVMLTEDGLGDQSFNDSSFKGLKKAREGLGIEFDYREIAETDTYEKGLTELVKDGNDLIIGVGFSMQEDLEKVAKKYPKKQFLLIDAASEVKNVTSVTFKEEQGSYLAGALAAMTTKSDVIGFVGGVDADVIHRFEKGFSKGAKSINPKIIILTTYAGTFNDAGKGGTIAKEMIKKKADVLYAAAGYTGVGVLKQAQAERKYAIGVDSDQYFTAEKAVISSMVKKVDEVVYQFSEQLVKNNKIKSGHVVYDLSNNGLDMARIRVLKNTESLTEKLNELKQTLLEEEEAAS
ncbi:BMP family ABC transporter substrate-binding protein [Bacillus pumilus]|nr:BMP family ABC transporter substrate-binding protein [Bacillus pumilus]